MVDFKQVDEARKLLGLDDTTTMEEIKNAYRRLALKYHPDKCTKRQKKKCEALFKKINNAHKILMAYCVTYGPSFNIKDVKKNTMGKEYYEHLKRFYDGWWGNLDL